MNQRTAMLTAGGLVLAMVVAGVALAMGITGPSQAAARVSDGRRALNPIVRTVRSTETVHRQAQGSGSAVGQSATFLPAIAPATFTSGSGDNGTEVEQGTEQGVEQESGSIQQEHEDD